MAPVVFNEISLCIRVLFLKIFLKSIFLLFVVIYIIVFVYELLDYWWCSIQECSLVHRPEIKMKNYKLNLKLLTFFLLYICNMQVRFFIFSWTQWFTSSRWLKTKVFYFNSFLSKHRWAQLKLKKPNIYIFLRIIFFLEEKAPWYRY